MQAGARLAELESAVTVEPIRPAPTFFVRGEKDLQACGYRAGRILNANSATIVIEAQRHGHRCALKFTRDRAESAARLRDEYRLGRRLKHPGIARPQRWIAHGSLAGIEFEYYAGGDLVSLAGAAPRHWAGPARRLAEALAYLHARGLVHRDVKARNVMFAGGHTVVLIDLGSCRPAGSPWRAGGTTAGHRRPGRPDVVSPWDDVHAYAVLIAELLGPDPSANHGVGETFGGGSALTELTAATLAEAIDHRRCDQLPESATRAADRLRQFSAVLESMGEAVTA